MTLWDTGRRDPVDDLGALAQKLAAGGHRAEISRSSGHVVPLNDHGVTLLSRLTLDRTIDHLRWRRRRSRRAATIAAHRLVRSIAPIPTFTFRLGEHGRLGNQLFQIAGTIGLAAQMNTDAVFRKDWQYREYFSLPDELLCRPDHGNPVRPGVAARGRHCEEARLWLQDASLWEACRESIDRWLQPSELARRRRPRGTPSFSRFPSKTSIHVRRGDYLAGPSPRTIPNAYYKETVELIKADDPSTQFLVFSDDIEWCRRSCRFAGVFATSPGTRTGSTSP